jgi:STAM-binding protein
VILLDNIYLEKIISAKQFIHLCRKHGIFRLTTPGGMSVIRQCQQRGFHPHDQPPDGGPIYKTCTDVYMNPDLKFDVIDLR